VGATEGNTVRKILMNVLWGQRRFLHVRMEATVLMASIAIHVTAQAPVRMLNGHRAVWINFSLDIL
jgi:hypothetical protein